MTSNGTNKQIECDLLIVGSTDSVTPAAAQAARMGVKRIVVVNDIEWFGGQWSTGGLSMIDEFAMYRGRRGLYPRSGVHLELIRYIRDYNRRHFGMASPGNARAYQGTTPEGAAEAFRAIMKPYEDGGTGQVQVFTRYRPAEVTKDGNRLTGVIFESVDDTANRITVSARLTIDASDWGDVIKRSGANYFVGPDPKSRFGEEGAPEVVADDLRNEANAINWCPVLKETGKDSTIERPADYDERLYYNSTPLTAQEFDALGFPKEVARGRALPFNDTVPLGGYTVPGIDNIYTHRRLVDRRHNELTGGVDTTVIVRPPQDYPIFNFPKKLADALEASEKGASRKSIPDMTYEQRELVWNDAKQYYLGYIYFLQTTAHERMGDYPESFKYMELSDEFGTPDKLPPKPYIREGMRLDALYNSRRQDFDTGVPMNSKGAGWDFAPNFHDSVFSWQCWYDFHTTRRVFLNDDSSQPWVSSFKTGFHSTETYRANFPLRGLVPAEVDGLLGSYINIGHSSIVCSGLRWHCMMPGVGQASAAVAAVALRENVEPRDVARDFKLIRDVQKGLVSPPGGAPGLALVGYQDLSPDLDSDRLFQAANFLGVRGIMLPQKGTLDFDGYGLVTRRDMAGVVARAYRSLAHAKPFAKLGQPLFTDIAADDADRGYIESLSAWGVLEAGGAFEPDAPADWPTLHAWMKGLDMQPNDGLIARNFRMEGGPEHLNKPQLWRWDMAVHVWAAIKDVPEYFPETGAYLTAGNDLDSDGRPDRDDALPFDRNNDGIPDRLDPGAE
ncbi:MAG TPA: FAD-dependent oxidoreductase [Devosiaceae bacterium]